MWERESMVEDGVKEGAQRGSGQEPGGRGRSAVNRAEFSSCGPAVSCGKRDRLWWRTELELSSGESFDDGHRSAALGTKPQRVRCHEICSCAANDIGHLEPWPTHLLFRL
jgi:hypothetical protein